MSEQIQNKSVTPSEALHSATALLIGANNGQTDARNRGEVYDKAEVRRNDNTGCMAKDGEIRVDVSSPEHTRVEVKVPELEKSYEFVDSFADKTNASINQPHKTDFRAGG